MAARAVMEAHLAGLLESRLGTVVFDRIGATDSMMEYCRRKGTDFRLIAPACLEVELLGMQSAHRFDCMGLTF